MSDMYILDESGKPIAEPDIIKWGKWFEQRERRIVRQEMVGELKVSNATIPEEFWEHYETVTGRKVPTNKRAEGFRCAC